MCTDDIHRWSVDVVCVDFPSLWCFSSSQTKFICDNTKKLMQTKFVCDDFLSHIHRWSVDVNKKIAIRTEKHTDKIHRWSVDLISTYCTIHKEGETTQTRFTDDLWTSIENKDRECVCDTNNMHRSSVDLICTHHKDWHEVRSPWVKRTLC